MEHLKKCVSSASTQAPNLPHRITSSAWKQHGPFAFWLIEAHRPRTLVELGTYHGFSYLCFCQQIKRMKLPARCAAVDTWQGDKHAGFYSENVFENLRHYHDPLYSSFSSLIRSNFDDACELFADASIDLLHIDGRHRYEDVRHDYELWKPKLSSRAIVLFHDTQVRERDFGVFRVWEEVSKQFPNFEFKHGYGLGVLGVGEEHRSLYFPLFSVAHDEEATRSIRNTYEKLGDLLDSRNISLPAPESNLTLFVQSLNQAHAEWLKHTWRLRLLKIIRLWQGMGVRHMLKQLLLRLGYATRN